MHGDRRLPHQARAVLTNFVRTANWSRVRAVSEARLSECERIVGLAQPDLKFRDAITDAIFFSLCLHFAPPRRASTVRRDLHLVAKKAAAAATALEHLSKALSQSLAVPLSGDDAPEPLATLFDLATIECLRGLAVVAGEAASRTKDAGGPPKMVAFGIFVRLLADAFGRATGHRAGMTWHEHRDRYEGRFWELIEVLLPVAKLVIGEGFAPKTPSARGKAIQRWLDRMDTTKAAPQ